MQIAEHEAPPPERVSPLPAKLAHERGDDAIDRAVVDRANQTKRRSTLLATFRDVLNRTADGAGEIAGLFVEGMRARLERQREQLAGTLVRKRQKRLVAEAGTTIEPEKAAAATRAKRRTEEKRLDPKTGLARNNPVTVWSGMIARRREELEKRDRRRVAAEKKRYKGLSPKERAKRKADDTINARRESAGLRATDWHAAANVGETWPGAIVGGTGWDSTVKLADVGITDDGPIDYTDYPRWSASLGFSQRGCRLRCPFCVVPKKEGGISTGRPIAEIWRGDPWPRHVVLLDNDFFGHPEWRARVRELTDGQFRVCLTQGINVRLIDDEGAEALASLDYRDGTFRERRLYTALDNPKDTGRFEAGVGRLIDHGVKGRHILVYMLIGFWPGETSADRIARLKTIRAMGALPYPMPFVRTPELIGFQRWAIGGYDRQIPWTDWAHADYQPRKFRLDLKAQGQRPLDLKEE